MQTYTNKKYHNLTKPNANYPKTTKRNPT